MSEGATPPRRVVLVTGGSRGIGAATALALAARGCDAVITYRNKAARAEEVVASIEALGRQGLAVAADMTQPDAVAHLFAQVAAWGGHLDLLVLNASGGLERDLVAADPEYPLRLNRDAQLAMVDAALPLLAPGSTIAFITSHWAHRYGQIQQLPAYEPVAMSKHAGEVALRERQGDLAARGIRLIVITGDLVEGTITPRLLARAADRSQHAADKPDTLPTTTEMGEAIASAATDPTLPTGHTVVVGRALDEMTASREDDGRVI
jgi:NAD(P)-dependent dehydrogenase (short-subunit alcohol dehydrogenase family)